MHTKSQTEKSWETNKQMKQSPQNYGCFHLVKDSQMTGPYWTFLTQGFRELELRKDF